MHKTEYHYGKPGQPIIQQVHIKSTHERALQTCLKKLIDCYA